MPNGKDWDEWNALFNACREGQQIFRLSDIRKEYILKLEKYVRNNNTWEADKAHHTKEISIEMAQAIGIVDFTDDNFSGEEKIDYWEIINRFQKTIYDLYPEADIKLNSDNRKKEQKP